MRRVLFALIARWLLTAVVTAQPEYQQQWGYILQSPSIWNRCNILRQSGYLVDCEKTAVEIPPGSWTMAFHQDKALITNFEQNQTSTCDISQEDHLLRACKSSKFYKKDFRPSDIHITGDRAYILNGKELDEAFISMCNINSGTLEGCRDVWSGTQYPYMMNIFQEKVHLTFDNSSPNGTEQIEVCPVDMSTGMISEQCTKTGPPGSQMLAAYDNWIYVLTAMFKENLGDTPLDYASSEYQRPVFELQKCAYSSSNGSITDCQKSPYQFNSPFSMRSNGKYLFVTAFENISRCEVAPITGDIIDCTTSTHDLGQTEFYDLVFNPRTSIFEDIQPVVVPESVVESFIEEAPATSPSTQPPSAADMARISCPTLWMIVYATIAVVLGTDIRQYAYIL